MKQQFVADVVGTFKLYVYANNRKAVPTAAAITVYKPGSAEKLINAQTMTIASDGLLSYVLTATNNDDAAENYKAVVNYTVDGTVQDFTSFYDVVISRLSTIITDDDLMNELPHLRDKAWSVHGTVDSGSATTIVDAELKRYEDDYFTGGLATNLTNDETREVTDFVSSTGTVTALAFATVNAAGNKYMIQRSFGKEIQRAFEKIEEKLRQSGKRAHLVLDPHDLRETHILFSVAAACKGMAKDVDSFWWDIWKDYEKQAFDSFAALSFKYDASGDGTISGAENNRRMKTIKVKF